MWWTTAVTAVGQKGVTHAHIVGDSRGKHLGRGGGRCGTGWSSAEGSGEWTAKWRESRSTHAASRGSDQMKNVQASRAAAKT